MKFWGMFGRLQKKLFGGCEPVNRAGWLEDRFVAVLGPWGFVIG